MEKCSAPRRKCFSQPCTGKLVFTSPTRSPACDVLVGVNETESKEFQRLSLIEPDITRPTAYFVLEQSRSMLFLLDTGATRSILPSGLFKPDKACNQFLRGITGKIMNVVGKICINLEFSFTTSFDHEFLIAEIPDVYGILGCDFFEKHKLRLCASTLRLTHVPSNSSVEVIKTNGGERAARKLILDKQGYSSKIMSNIVKSKSTIDDLCFAESSVSVGDMLWGLVNNFSELFVEPSYHQPPKHGFVLDIDLEDNCPSIYQKPRKAPAAEQKAIRENFEKLAKQGVVVKSSSNFASPVTVVKKKNGDFRICVDYTKLNRYTKSLNFPLPNISNLQSIVNKEHRWFSTLDLKSAYYSLPMTPRASKLAAIISHQGTFLPLRSPFGLKNSPAKFCELIASVVEGIETFVFAYIDDFLIFSRTLEEHKQHLVTLLSRLRSYGLFLNRNKCVLGRSKILYLGHEINCRGLRPLSK